MGTSPRKPRRVAYTMSRFPKITETFILYEILELQRQGLEVEVFPLIREAAPVVHAEAQAVVERAHYSKPLAPPVLAAQLYWLLRRPLAYLRAWWATLRGNFGSPKFMSRALVVVPQAAYAARRMRELGVEHLHAHYATHPALLAYVVALLADIPYSFTVHAHDLYVERAMLGEKIAAASFVVAISDYNRRLIGQLYGEAAAARTAVIHCGIDPAVFAPRGERPANARFTMVCVASLAGYKGQRYLIDAVAGLAAQGLALRLVLVGEGEDRPALEAQIRRLGLEQIVELVGAQPRHRVRELLGEADVVVLPSVVMPSGKMEGIPVALMEALASEIPVVATAISGLPELIADGETGLLVPERDAAALAVALRRLYDDPALGRRLAAAGRAHVLREFNLERNTTALRRLLERRWPAPSSANAAPSEMVQVEWPS